MVPSSSADLAAVSDGLPAELDTFIGRERDLQALRGLLDDVRLVTLCAQGGMGKTRLAVRLGLEISDEFGDGARLVELADLHRPEELTARVAERLGVVDEHDRDRSATLADALRHREMLLILDNCEHLIDEAAGLTARLLTACPALRVIATSREPLRVAGETVWRVPPLTVPPPGHDRVEAYGHEAVRLSAERAVAVRPAIELTPADADVARVCRALDGLPLAIELAAARVSVLSSREIADRLHDRFALLTTGGRHPRPAHRPRGQVAGDQRAGAGGRVTLSHAPDHPAVRRPAPRRGRREHPAGARPPGPHARRMRVARVAAAHAGGRRRGEPGVRPAAGGPRQHARRPRLVPRSGRVPAGAAAGHRDERVLVRARAVHRRADLGRPLRAARSGRTGAPSRPGPDLPGAVGHGARRHRAGRTRLQGRPGTGQGGGRQLRDRRRAARPRLGPFARTDRHGAARPAPRRPARGAPAPGGGLVWLREVGSRTGIARALTGLARLALAEGDAGTAHARITEALLLCRDSGQRLAAARILEVAAGLAATGDDHERVVLLAAATSAARDAAGAQDATGRLEKLTARARETLGADAAEALWRSGRDLDPEAAVRLALEIGTDSGSGGDRSDLRDLLTPREREIATLIARGSTNRDIARELYISPATAARHVANIFAKLEVSSRAQLAAWATRAGLH